MIDVKNVNVNKLADELQRAGVVASLLSNLKEDEAVATEAQIIIDGNVDMELVQSIIDAHDPTPIPPEPSEIEKIRLEMARSNAEMFEAVIALVGGM